MFADAYVQIQTALWFIKHDLALTDGDKLAVKATFAGSGTFSVSFGVNRRVEDCKFKESSNVQGVMLLDAAGLN